MKADGGNSVSSAVRNLETGLVNLILPVDFVATVRGNDQVICP